MIRREDNSRVDYTRKATQNAGTLYEVQPEVMVSISSTTTNAGLQPVQVFLSRAYKNILKISLVRVSGDSAGNSIGLRRICVQDEQGQPIFTNWQNAGSVQGAQDGWIQVEANAGYSNAPIAVYRDGQGKMPQIMNVFQTDASGNALADTSVNLALKLTLSEWQ